MRCPCKLEYFANPVPRNHSPITIFSFPPPSPFATVCLQRDPIRSGASHRPSGAEVCGAVQAARTLPCHALAALLRQRCLRSAARDKARLLAEAGGTGMGQPLDRME